MAQFQESRIKKNIKARTKKGIKSRIVYQGINQTEAWDIKEKDKMSDARLKQLQQGVIWAEILGRPVSKRRGRGRFGI